MKEMISGIFTVKMKPSDFFSKDNEKRFEEYTICFQIGEMDFYKNGKAYIKLFNDRALAEEVFEPSVEAFLEKGKNGKTKVNLVYRNGFSVFNGFFSEGEKNQFSVRESGGFNRLGILETSSVKNTISEDGGKLVLKFKATHSCFVNTLSIIEIDVSKYSEDDIIGELYS